MTRNPTKPRWQRSHRTSWALLVPTVFALTVVVALYLVSQWFGNPASGLVVYVAQDQVYAEPIFRAFEQESGLPVRAVFDSEAVKTVGLVNRLIAEQDHPRCDVFWNNEELRIRQLSARGVLDKAQPWVALGYRSRRIVINTNLVSPAEVPRSLLDLTSSVWRQKVALAYPLFGTTATHFLALRQHWGDSRWRQWCRALAASEARVVDGNSVVVKLVGQGEACVGLTDSDDIAAGQRAGLPLLALPLDQDSLLIPNTVALVQGAPHPALARRLIAFLQRPDTVQRLVAAGALEAATAPVDPVGLKPDWDELLRRLDDDTTFLREVFLR